MSTYAEASQKAIDAMKAEAVGKIARRMTFDLGQFSCRSKFENGVARANCALLKQSRKIAQERARIKRKGLSSLDSPMLKAELKRRVQAILTMNAKRIAEDKARALIYDDPNEGRESLLQQLLESRETIKAG